MYEKLVEYLRKGNIIRITLKDANEKRISGAIQSLDKCGIHLVTILGEESFVRYGAIKWVDDLNL